MNLIGLTGGIGSGKSTVAGIFKTLGVPIYDSDLRAKYLMNSKEGLREKIIDLFGPDAYSANRQLNRSWMASRVFTDRDQLNKLNAIVHPAVYEDLLEWASQPEQLLTPYLIQESAILFEEDLTGRLKGIILVVASEETRLSRVMNRDNITRNEVIKRINHQWPDNKKIPLSDYVIYNDGDRPLIGQVTDIDKMIRSTLV